MQTVSENYKTAIEARTRSFANRVTIGTVEVTAIKKLEISDTFNSDSENLTMGCACSKKLDIEFYVPPTLTGFSKEAIKVESGLKLPDETYEYVLVGVFYPETIKSEDGNVTARITAYDSMAKLNVQYQPTVSLPTTDTEIVNDICTKYGITFVGKTLGCPINKVFEGTVAQTLGCMAGLQGLNARMTRDNKLDFSYYIMPRIWGDIQQLTWQQIGSMAIADLSRKDNG